MLCCRLQEDVKQLQEQLHQSERAQQQLEHQQQQQQWSRQGAALGLFPAGLQLLVPSLLASSSASDADGSASSAHTISTGASWKPAATQPQEQQHTPLLLCKLQQQLNELHMQQQPLCIHPGYAVQEEQSEPQQPAATLPPQQPAYAAAGRPTATAGVQRTQQAPARAGAGIAAGVSLQPSAAGTEGQQGGAPAAAAAAAVAPAGGGVVCLTQQDLDFILGEVEHMQQRLAAVAGTSLAVATQQQQQPSSYQQQQGCVPAGQQLTINSSLTCNTQVADHRPGLQQQQQQQPASMVAAAAKDRAQLVAAFTSGTAGCASGASDSHAAPGSSQPTACINTAATHAMQHRQQQQQGAVQVMQAARSSRPPWNYQWQQQIQLQQQ
jgi:hypothetical protein